MLGLVFLLASGKDSLLRGLAFLILTLSGIWAARQLQAYPLQAKPGRYATWGSMGFALVLLIGTLILAPLQHWGQQISEATGQIMEAVVLILVILLSALGFLERSADRRGWLILPLNLGICAVAFLVARLLI